MQLSSKWLARKPSFLPFLLPKDFLKTVFLFLKNIGTCRTSLVTLKASSDKDVLFPLNVHIKLKINIHGSPDVP